MLDSQDVQSHAWPDLDDRFEAQGEDRALRFAQALEGVSPVGLRVSRAYLRKGLHLAPYPVAGDDFSGDRIDPERDAFLVQVHYAIDREGGGQELVPVLDEIESLQREITEADRRAFTERLAEIDIEAARLRKALGDD